MWMLLILRSSVWKMGGGALLNHIRYIQGLAAMVAQWLRCLGADPKDGSLIPAAEVAYWWRPFMLFLLYLCDGFVLQSRLMKACCGSFSFILAPTLWIANTLLCIGYCALQHNWQSKKTDVHVVVLQHVVTKMQNQFARFVTLCFLPSIPAKCNRIFKKVSVCFRQVKPN